MKGRVMLSINIFFMLILFSGCTSTNRIFSKANYNNPKPDRETRDRYILAHPDLDAKITGLIRNGLVEVGMSKEEVKASWGEPDSIKSTSKFGADEMWYYWDNPKFHRYVYFSKNIVIKIE